jgi:hypothetical protein
MSTVPIYTEGDMALIAIMLPLTPTPAVMAEKTLFR